MSERLAEMVRGIPYPYEGSSYVTQQDAGYRNGWHAGRKSAADLIANSPELAEMRRDAERYRYLAESAGTIVFDPTKRLAGSIYERDKTLDAAIDAAQLGEVT